MDYKSKIEVIKKLMRANGISKMVDLAKMINMNPNGLTSGLKYMLKTESYNTAFAQKLANALDIPIKELANALNGKAMDTRISSLGLIEERRSYFTKIYNSYQKEISELIQNLSKGDSYSLMTTENPWEYRDIDMRNCILAALKKGVTFKYIFPKKDDEQLKKIFNDYENNLEWMELDTMHERFIQRMTELANQDVDFKKNSEFIKNPQEYIRSHLNYYSTSNVLIANPMFKLMLIETKILGDIRHFAFAEAIVAEQNLEMNNSRNSFWYPLPKNEISILNKNLSKIITNDRDF